MLNTHLRNYNTKNSERPMILHPPCRFSTKPLGQLPASELFIKRTLQLLQIPKEQLSDSPVNGARIIINSGNRSHVLRWTL